MNVLEDGPVVDIVDVGHGSCVAIRCGSTVTLIDAGPGGAVLEYLRREQITQISNVIISHADADHIGGLSAILAQKDLSVGRIIWNGDSAKQSQLWKNLIYQLADLQDAGRTVAYENAYDGLVVDLDPQAGVAVHVFAPGLVLRQLGAGSSTRDGRAISSNSVSVVVQLVVEDESVLLVMGDLDHLGFELLVGSKYGDRLQSRHLVLPHHGGLMGSRSETAAAVSQLVARVNPEVVFVSNGRRKFNNPRREVVDAIRSTNAAVAVSCTQLAESCAKNPVERVERATPYSAGWLRGASCQGSARLTLGNGIGAPLNRRQHLNFLAQSVPGAICGQGAKAKLSVLV